MIGTQKLWLVISIIIALCWIVPQILIDEENFVKTELEEAHKLMPQKLHLLKHFENNNREGFIISEIMPLGFVPEFKDRFFVTYDNFKLNIPVYNYFNWNQCDFKGIELMKKLPELIYCEPKSMIVTNISNVDELTHQYPELKFIQIDKSKTYVVLMAELINT